MRNESASATDVAAGSVTVDLTPYLRVGGSCSGSRDEGEARVKRMTSPGLDSKDVSQVTWAGQSFENGTAMGVEVVEGLQNGTMVTVPGSEAVLVFF